MGDFCRFVLPGRPHGKGVAQVTRHGTFIPKKTRAEMDAMRMIARLAMRGRAPFRGPVELKLAAYMPIPSSWSRAKRAAAISGELKAVARPDLSNIIKLAEDCVLSRPERRNKAGRVTQAASEAVIVDDGQVVKMTCWKLFSADPRVVVEIREIDGAAEL